MLDGSRLFVRAMILGLLALVLSQAYAENYNPKCTCSPPTVSTVPSGPDEVCPDLEYEWELDAYFEDGEWSCNDGTSGPTTGSVKSPPSWTITNTATGEVVASGVGFVAKWKTPVDCENVKRGAYTVSWSDWEVDVEPEKSEDCEDFTQPGDSLNFTFPDKVGAWDQGIVLKPEPEETDQDIMSMRNNGTCREMFKMATKVDIYPWAEDFLSVEVDPIAANEWIAAGGQFDFTVKASDERLKADVDPTWEFETAGEIEFVDSCTKELGKVEIKLRKTPGPPRCLPPPFNNADGRHRSVDVYGVPKPEASPTGEGEGDYKPDTTYVDMLSLSPSYSVTDVSVPVEGGELALEVRRTTGIRSMNATADPNGEAGRTQLVLANERLLGFGWSCNLSSHLQINTWVGTGAGKVQVVDDLGQTYGFAESFMVNDQGQTVIGYAPVYDYGWDHEAFRCSLTSGIRNVLGVPATFTLRKRFGTEIHYTYAGFYKSDDGTSKQQLVYRIDRVVDRNGNTIVYGYVGPVVGNSHANPFEEVDQNALDQALLVASVTEAAHAERRLSFGYSKVLATPILGSDAGWRLSTASDPSGRTWNYNFTSPPAPSITVEELTEGYELPGVGPVLGSVQRPLDTYDGGVSVRATTTYTYYMAELLAGHIEINKPIPVNRYIAPATVLDPRGHSTGFQYGTDEFNSECGDPIKALILATLTTNAGTMQVGVDERDRAPVFEGGVGRMHVKTHVIDTTGTRIDYDFTYIANSAETNARNLTKIDRTTTVGGAIGDVTATFEYENNPLGSLSSVTDIQGNVIVYEYESGAANDSFDDPVLTPLFAQVQGVPNYYRVLGVPARRIVDPIRPGAQNPLNLVTEYRYETTYSKLLTQIDAEGVVSQYEFDAAGNRTAVVENAVPRFGSSVRRSEMFYTTDGFLNKSIDPEGRVSEFHRTFHTVGANVDRSVFKRVESRRYPEGLGAGKPILRDAQAANLYGDALYTLDGNNNRTDLVYDNSHRVIASVRPPVPAALRTSDPAYGVAPRHAIGSLPNSVDPLPALPEGSVRYQSDVFYDVNGNSTRQIDENGHVAVVTYDFHNRPLTTRQRMVSAQADANDDLVSQIFYDPRGLSNRTRDARNQETVTKYDNLLRPVERILPGLGFDDVLKQPTGPQLHEFMEYGDNSGAGTWSVRSGWQATRTINARGIATDSTFDAIYRPTQVVNRLDDGAGVPSDAPARLGEPVSQTSYNKVHKPILTKVWDDQLGAQGNWRISATYYNYFYEPTVQTASYGQPLYLTPEFVTNGRTFAVGYPSRVVRLEYDASGLPLVTIDPLGRESNSVYDLAGRKLTEQGPLVTDIGGSVAGRPTVAMAYDGASNVIVSTNTRGHKTRSYVDAWNRPWRTILDLDDDGEFEINGDDIVSQTHFDAVSKPIQTLEPRQFAADRTQDFITDVYYDAASRAVRILAPEVPDAEHSNILTRPETSSVYDDNGNVITVVDARGIESHTLYDAYNRPLRVRSSWNTDERVETETRYDANGNVLELTLRNEVGANLRPQTTTYTYDTLDRKKLEVLPWVTDGLPRESTWTYSTMNQATEAVDPMGQRMRMRYNGFGEATRVTVLKADGQLDQERQQLYSSTGKLLEVEELLPNSALGRQVTAYTYDNLDRLVTEAYRGWRGVDAEPSLTTSSVVSGYDLGSNRIRSETAGATGSRVIQSFYDVANRIHVIQDDGDQGSQTTYAYDLAGNRLSCVRPGGILDVYAFDGLGRVKTATSTVNGAISYAVSYAYDLIGNRLHAREITAALGGGERVVHYTYDGQYRLEQEVAEDRVASWQYDLAGNRRRQSVQTFADNQVMPTVEVTTYITDDLNRLQSRLVETSDDEDPSGRTVTVSYQYDLNGNRIAEDHDDDSRHHEYHYDAINRLTSVDAHNVQEGSSDVIFSAAYDARTRRRYTAEAPTAGAILAERTFRYDGGDAYSEYVNSIEQVYFVRGSSMGGGIGGILYADRRSAGGTIESYFYNPAVGHTVATVERDGTTISANRYEAWGQLIMKAGDRTNNRLANTKERSEIIGLDNHGFRYYDPVIGRYISRDPIGYGDGPNVYLYAHNNPINRYDPLGLADKEWHHVIPKSEKLGLEGWAKEAGIDIHDSKYGALVDKATHTKMHSDTPGPEGGTKNWNKGWEDWKKGFTESGKMPSAEDFEKQIGKMSEQFADELKGALPTTAHYKADWGKMNKATKNGHIAAMGELAEKATAEGAKFIIGKGMAKEVKGAAAAALQGAGRAARGVGRLAGKLAPAVVVGMLVKDYAEGGFTGAGRGFMMADEVESAVTWGVGQLGGNWATEQMDRGARRFDKYLDEDE